MDTSKSRTHGNVSENNDVYVADHAGGGINYYVVMVNGKPYDEMTSRKRLTWSEQWDIAAGYKEALDGIGSAMLESETQ